MDLRSLYDWFNPEEAAKQKELYLLSLRPPNPTYRDGAYPLVNRLLDKQNILNEGNGKNQRPTPDEEERANYNALDWFYNRPKPPKYPGSI